ncbi:5-hydroxytryptamine receptor 1B-like [Paramacrobiotus metropolitanus]|uniref:5-hydroxytryptamine receptor 1B-like n=1 Tax=Paramacrobiotus metropolitanus TaxID=2943436 RepID=UPI00244611FF|nr:5-hydroxytryptamine receptor 1B-like [Paramacrobiotus metropolitanus]
MSLVGLTKLVVEVLLNAFLLIVLLTARTLHTPFTIYLVNLVIATLLFIILFEPISIMYSLDAFRSRLGEKVCGLFKYATYNLPDVIVQTHIVITLNRVWAILKPHHYQRRHSRKLAIGFCLWTWVYPHVIVVPGLILDATVYNIPVTQISFCMLNMKALRGWLMARASAMMLLPILFLICANVCLMFWRARWFKREVSIVVQDCTDVTEKPVSTAATTPTTVKRENSRGLLLLIGLTVSMAVCWIPGATCMMYMTFASGLKSQNGPDLMTWAKVSGYMFSMQTIVDPVVIILTFRDFKKVAKSYFTNLVNISHKKSLHP